MPSASLAWLSIAALLEQSGAMARILIVEDEAIVAMTMSMVLDSAGHQVVGIANDEASAAKQVARSRPDLALVDIKLANNSDGVQTALRLKARHPLKVVFVSGYLDSHTQKRAAAVDPAGYVVKPYSARNLLKVVSIATALAWPRPPDAGGARPNSRTKSRNRNPRSSAGGRAETNNLG